MSPQTEHDILALWTKELADAGVAPARLRSDFLGDTERARHTFTAADARGRILSAAWYRPRLLRDVEGAPRRTACVIAVATEPDSRGLGHATRLMQELSESARSEGCEWAMLLTRVPAFYERIGWRRMRTRYRQGLLSDWQHEASRSIGPLARRHMDWQALAPIHTAYNESRPLTLVRDERYWRETLASRLASPGGQVLLACEVDSDEPIGYAVVGWYPKDEAFEVYELAARPGHDYAICDLLGSVARKAHRRGIIKGRVYLPCEPIVDSALARLFSSVYTEWWELAMALPLSADWTHDRLEALFQAPGAIFWPLDDF